MQRDSDSPRERVAILNGFGRTLGDSIIGMQALFAARATGALPPSRPVLFRLPGLSPTIEEIYAAGADLAEIRELPWADETPSRAFAGAADFGRIIDIRDFAFDPAFASVAMIDFFLARLGVAPAHVPPALKRNGWLAPRLPHAVQAGANRRHILVCPRSSNAMRDMPDGIHDRILGWLRRNADLPVITQAEMPPCESLGALAGLVASAHAVISTDTGMIHLADAFETPCLAFFTTHHPEWRARDYPLCRSVHLACPSLPASIEFARDEADIAAARTGWFRHGDDPDWVCDEVAAFLRGNAETPAAA